jgi:PAS domain S-box-containing protein
MPDHNTSSTDSVPSQLTADSIVDTLREPVLILTADLRVKKANRPFYRTFKVTPEETIDLRIYDLGNGQWDIPWLRKLLEDVWPGKTSLDDFEVDQVFPKIGRKQILLNARRICKEGDVTEFILLAMEDVTERREAEVARHEIESRYTSLVENIKDHSIFMMDTEGNIISWNKEAERIIGYAESEILGRNFAMIFTPDDLRDGLPQQELLLAKKKGRAEDERWHVRKDGSRFWAFGIVTPLRDASGTQIGFSKILRDITERKLAEQKLQEQAAALKEADRMKNEFIATLAHELRNPLAPLRNGLQIIQHLESDTDAVNQAKEIMDRQLNLLVRLVDDLLDMSRITKGMSELRKQRVELKAIVQNAVETSRPVVESSHHKLTVELPSEPIWLEADPIRMAQVVSNLLNNSARYTASNGCITLTAEQAGAWAVIKVKDNGIGMPTEMLHRIFEMFIQVKGSSDRPQGGLGIGLALVRGLVEMHGGTVEAHSDGDGMGSEFIVRLPIAEATAREAQVAHQDEGQTNAQSPSRRILIADDNEDGAKSLAMLLRLAGHKVHVAHNGQMALKLAQSENPQIAILDIKMPDMDGHEVARRLRQQAGLENIVLVAMTGYGQPEDRLRSQEAGFTHHLTKPVDSKQLNELIASCVEND